MTAEVAYTVRRFDAAARASSNSDCARVLDDAHRQTRLSLAHRGRPRVRAV